MAVCTLGIITLGDKMTSQNSVEVDILYGELELIAMVENLYVSPDGEVLEYEVVGFEFNEPGRGKYVNKALADRLNNVDTFDGQRFLCKVERQYHLVTDKNGIGLDRDFD